MAPALAPILALWSWALAALLTGLLAAHQWRRAGGGLPRRAFALALTAGALWALAMAGRGGAEGATRVAEQGRTLAWLGFMWALAGPRARRGREGLAVGAIYLVVAALAVTGTLLGIAQAAPPARALAPMLGEARLLLRMMVAVSALVLTHHLYAVAAPGRAGGLRLVLGTLAAMWLGDLATCAAAWTLGGWPPALEAARGIATLLLAPALAIAAHRDGEWTLSVSRTVALQSLSAAAVALYIAAMLVGTSLLGLVGDRWQRVAQTAFVFGTTTALLTLLANPWLRAFVRVKIAKHLFRHRYDYRAEWVRFTDTLGVPGDAAQPLEWRICKAVADVTCSPAALLLVPDGDALGVASAWNWDGGEGAGEALARHLTDTGRIVELDAVRGRLGDPGEAGAVPAWMLAHPDAWAIVPLSHLGTLAGAILLARPPVDRALDWEDFDLLRICGRQVASYLAEQRAQGALAEAQRFDEFNRRFAFILHDIKNLVSQVSLVARNAERHADNPAFRADMVATLRETAERMTALLARLAQVERGREEGGGPVALRALAERVARDRRAQHAVVVEGLEAFALADAARVEQLLGHLVQNAIEASAGAPVRLVVVAAEGGVAVDVIDAGPGMAPAFVRDELFRPFVSTKPGGFGIGAFEARQIARALGGGIEVWSREGEGTRFRVTLPAAQPEAWEKAA